MVYRKIKLQEKGSNKEIGKGNDSFEMEDFGKYSLNNMPAKEAKTGGVIDGFIKKSVNRSKKNTLQVSVEKPELSPQDHPLKMENDCFLNITVHRTDRLKVSPTISRLFVRIHLMDTESEDYIRVGKKLIDNSSRSLANLIPRDTKAVSTKYQDLLMPVWDDVILIPQNFHAISSNKNIILFFEILDTNGKAYESSDFKMHTEKNTGCSMVAWAFLLLTNSNGGLNVGHKKQRLQLYEPIIKKSFHSIEKKLDNLPIGKVSGLGVLQKNQLIRNNSPNFSEYSSMESGYHLLSCWKSGSRYRVPYPSSIYVTVKEIITTELLENQLQEKLICKVPSEQPTLSMINLSEPGLPENINVVSDNEEHIVSNVDTEIDEVTELQDFWIRKSNQPRHIPNMLAGYGITTSMKLNDSNLSKDMKSNQSHYPLTKSYGAQCLTFSPDGKWLAVGVIRHFILNSTTGICAVHRTNKMDCSILIYKYPLNSKRSQPNLELAGHSDIIYSLDWAKTPILQTSNNKSDQKSPRRSSVGTKVFWILASGSADGTVRVWRLHLNRIYKKAINDYNPISLSDGNVVVSRSSTLSQVKVGQIINGLSHKKGVLCNVLGHPNFVYSVVFKPERTEFDRQESQNIQNFFVQTHLLATGCYDRTIRLWIIKHSQAQLLQELNGIHQSHINSLTFDKDGSHIYSGDASGLVAVWQKSNHQRNQVKSQSKWMFEKKIEVRELEMCVINHLEIHPTLNLLLVHQRDNCLKMLDLRSDFITTRFHGALNNTELLRSCISPCGSLLFSGSEDGNVYVWNVNTGDQVEIYQNLLLPGSVTSISYHPMDNVVAFSVVGPESPVAIYKYDIKAGQLSASHLQSKREISHSQGGEINYTEQPPDILTSHVKFKKGNAERILLAVSKLESVLNVSKPQIHNPGYQNDLHELEWRPTYTVIDETSNQRGTVNKLDSRTSSTSQMQAIKGNENMFIALYDYEAQRSDELHLKRGDVVKVLYKDSPKWWMAKSIRTGQQGFILASYVSRNYLGEENDGGRQTISENTRNLSSSLETNSNSQSQTPSGAIHQSDALRNSLQARYPRVIGNNDSDYDPVDSQINRLRTTNSNIQSNKPNLSLTKKRKSSTRPLPTLD